MSVSGEVSRFSSSSFSFLFSSTFDSILSSSSSFSSNTFSSPYSSAEVSEELISFIGAQSFIITWYDMETLDLFRRGKENKLIPEST